MNASSCAHATQQEFPVTRLDPFSQSSARSPTITSVEARSAPDPTWELQLREAAERGLASIKLPGDWVGKFRSLLETSVSEASDEYRIRHAGGHVLRWALEAAFRSPLDRSIYGSIAKQFFDPLSEDDFDVVLNEAMMLMVAVIARYETATGRYWTPGPNRLLFPVRSHFPKWTNNYVAKAAREEKKRQTTPVVLVQLSEELLHDELKARLLEVPNKPDQLPVLRAGRACISPDVRARTIGRERHEFESLQTVQQAYLMWRRDPELEPREVVSDALAATKPHFKRSSKNLNRELANVAHGVVQLLDECLAQSTPDGVIDDELRRALEFGRLGWRALELEGVIKLLKDALYDTVSVGAQRVEARAVWAAEVLDWLESMGAQADPRQRRYLEKHVSSLVLKLTVTKSGSAVDVASERQNELIGQMVVQTHQRFETWLSATREGS
jgi:hypothetical protein